EARMRPNVPPKARVLRRHVEPREQLHEILPLGVGAKRRRRAAPGELREYLGAVRHQPRLLAGHVWRVRRQCEYDREPGQYALERVEACVRARHADMDVEPADSLPAR